MEVLEQQVQNHQQRDQQVVLQHFLLLLRLEEVVIPEQEALEVEEHIMQVEGLVIHPLSIRLKVILVVMV